MERQRSSKFMIGDAGVSVLDEAMTIDGAVGSALKDRTASICLATADRQGVNRDMDAIGGTEVLEATMTTISAPSLHDSIEYNPLLQTGQRHRCIVMGGSELFAHLAFNKANSNLAVPRRLQNVDDAKLN